MSATARRHNRPYLPSVVTALTVNQLVIAKMAVSDTGDGFLVHALSVAIHTTILAALIAASVMSWMSWHRDLVAVTVTVLPKSPTE